MHLTRWFVVVDYCTAFTFENANEEHMLIHAYLAVKCLILLQHLLVAVANVTMTFGYGCNE